MSKSNKSENPAIYQEHSIDPQLCRYAYSNPCNFDYTVTYKTIQIKNKTDRQKGRQRERQKKKKNTIKGYVSPNARIEEQRQASNESITGKGQHNMALLLCQERRHEIPQSSLALQKTA